MDDLLGLSRAELASSEALLKSRFRLHVVTVVLAIAALVVGAPATYWLALAGLATEAAAWVIRLIAHQRAVRGNRGLRLTMLGRNLGYDNSRESADMRASFSTAAKREASRYVDDTYWRAWAGGPGPAGLRAALQESAFWSAHLYAKARVAPAIKAFVLGIAAVAALLIVALDGDQKATVTVARMVVVLFGFLIATDLIGEALEFHTAGEAAREVQKRLDAVDMSSLGTALEVFSDYALATAGAPPIPDRIWKDHKSTLEALWGERGRAAPDPGGG